MTSASDIPREALDIQYNTSSVMPHIGLHQRGGVYYHESSHSYLWFSGVMLAIAVVVLMLPWDTRVGPSEMKLKYGVAAVFGWGGICILFVYFIRNKYGQVVTIDPKSKTIGLARGDFFEKIAWEQIVGLQVCRQKVPADSRMNGFQLNLVWADAGGKMRRHCLLKHAIRTFVVRLGRRYESLFGFRLVDHTRDNQPAPAGSDREMSPYGARKS